MDSRRQVHVVLLFLCVLTSTRAQLPTFRTHPEQTTVIRGETMTLKCRVTTEPADNELVQWYKDGDLLSVNSSTTSRFFITGNQALGEYDLTVTDTELEDTGEYYCKIREPESSSNIATITVIEPDMAWYPTCIMHLRSASKSEESRLAETGFIKGDKVAIECVSRGTPLPDLTWKEGDRTVPGILTKDVNESTVVNVFDWTLSEKDDGALYVCSANLPNLSNSPVCHIGPLDVRIKDSQDILMIPAIITGVLAGVAIILFGVVVILLFKYRQCKICRDMPDFHDPVQVMLPDDPSHLPRPISSTESIMSDDDDINVTVHIDDLNIPVQQLETAPPVPQTDRPDLEKIKSETINRNIDKDDNKKPVTEKVPNIELLAKRDNESQILSASNDTVLNIVPEPGPSTSSDVPPPVPTQSPSLCDETPNVLELQEESIYYIPKRRDSKKDKGGKKKERKFSKKKDKPDKITKRRKNEEFEDDKVVYAEITFSKDVGMNILIDDEEKDSNIKS